MDPPRPPSAPTRAPDPREVQNIILTGFMGTGKSMVGRVLSQRLGWKFVDLDRAIESDAGLSIPRIFEEKGEHYFRDLESAAAVALAEKRRRVVATGGGFVIRPENREAAMRAGQVVLLQASPDQIWHRVRGTRHRPLLDVADPRARIRELLDERQEAYQAIPIRINTDSRTPYSIADEIIDAVGLS